MELVDAQQRSLGTITVEGTEADLLSGEFSPGPAFPFVADIFRRFEEAVNAQALGVVDELDAAIARLGLLSLPGESQPIQDVQIYSDGGFSCRVAALAPSPVNGAARPAASRRPA